MIILQKILFVDRIEGDFAVCENQEREKTVLPLSGLPSGLREGDCLRETPEGYEIDPTQTADRKAFNKALFDRLLKRGSDRSRDGSPQ